MSSLERRYRRLLAWYPWEYRAEYQEEMLGVLLDAAGPSRTRPTVRETVDLLAGGLGYRMRSAGGEFTGAQLTGAQWRRVASVLAAAAPAVLLVATLYEFIGVLGLGAGYFGDRPMIGPSVWAPLVAWAVVTVTALAGPRLLAAGLGWLALLLEIAVQVISYERFGLASRPAVWTLTVALVAAVALSFGGAREGLRLLGRRRVAALAAIGLFVGVGPLVYAWLPSWSGMLVWGVGPRALTVLAGAVVLVRLDPPVRRRLLATLGALAGLGVLEGVSDGWFYGGGGRSHLVPLQALAVLAVTVAAFALTVTAIRRRERRGAHAG